MAGTSLLTLIDDIATLLDDVFLMSRIAVKKTAGVLGDDLALNAEQVVGVKADRELAVVWAVAKGSFLNKLILVPGALLISAFIPWAIIPLLMLGGAFLCFEGFEKVAHKLLHSKEEDEEHHQALLKAVQDEQIDLVAFEKDKIKGAIRTDFILSAEIIVITLGVVAAKPLLTQSVVLSMMAIGITIFIYGVVAGIVRLDDLGLSLIKSENSTKQSIGRGLLAFAPILMKTLSIVGTAAMFMVGGGILAHGIGPVHHAIEHAAQVVAEWPGGAIAAFFAPTVLNALFGVAAGGLLVAAFKTIGGLKARVAG